MRSKLTILECLKLWMICKASLFDFFLNVEPAEWVGLEKQVPGLQS